MDTEYVHKGLTELILQWERGGGWRVMHSHLWQLVLGLVRIHHQG